MGDDLNYDVFISYRRSDGLYATHLLHRNLNDSGYYAFFDKLSMRTGPFSPQLEAAINGATDFILLVTPDTFSKRIFKKDDWVRKEIEIALNSNKNILVLFTEDVCFPKKLPKSIKKIKDYQSESLKSASDLDEYEKTLFKRYLKTVSRGDCIDYNGRFSIYNFDFTEESERLKNQGSKYNDDNQRILDMYLKKTGYTVLDVGCAQGFVTRQAFAKEKYQKVVGIDINAHAIKEAKKDKGLSKFSFYELDIENAGFEEEMRKIMKKEGIEGFDVISCFLVLHHLRKPQQALDKLKNLLNEGGMIIIRGSDDGTKVSYGDDGLIAKVVRKSYNLRGMSDRNNGRKLFSWLVRRGFKNVKMHSKVTDTSHMSEEEKEGLFKVSFAYRINYFRRQVERNKNDETINEFNEMEDMLAKLQEIFTNRKDFWYALNSYVCVGFKK